MLYEKLCYILRADHTDGREQKRPEKEEFISFFSGVVIFSQSCLLQIVIKAKTWLVAVVKLGNATDRTYEISSERESTLIGRSE